MDEKKSKVFKPENKLKEKVGDGGFLEVDVARAQDVLENNDIDFKPLANDLLDQLEGAIQKVKSGEITSGKIAKDELVYPLLQLKAQGGMFNYPIITQISTDIMMFLEDIQRIDLNLLKILTSFHKSTKILVDLEIQDNSNPVAKQLHQELKAVCERYHQKKKI